MAKTGFDQFIENMGTSFLLVFGGIIVIGTVLSMFGSSVSFDSFDSSRKSKKNSGGERNRIDNYFGRKLDGKGAEDSRLNEPKDSIEMQDLGASSSSSDSNSYAPSDIPGGLYRPRRTPAQATELSNDARPLTRKERKKIKIQKQFEVLKWLYIIGVSMIVLWVVMMYNSPKTSDNGEWQFVKKQA